MSHPFTEIAHSDMYAAVFALFIRSGRVSFARFNDAIKALGGDDEDVTLIRHVMNLEGMRRANPKDIRSDYIWPELQQMFTHNASKPSGESHA